MTNRAERRRGDVIPPRGFRAAPGPMRQLQPGPPEMVWWPFIEEGERPETDGSGHLHWTITAFARLDDNGQLHDACVVEVEAEDEEGAVARAMAIIARPCYRVASVREACSIDPELRRAKE